MKVIAIFVATFMSVMTLNAHAWSLWELNGAKMDIDGKDIRVASVITSGDDHVYHSKDKELENGVYVVAVSYIGSSTALPHTTNLIRGYLRLRGMNVTDKPDGCALGIKFVVYDLNLDGASSTPGSQPEAKSKSLFDSTAAVANQVGLSELAFKLGGATAVITSGLAQGGHYSGAALELDSFSIINPTYDNLGTDASKLARDKNIITSRTAVADSAPDTSTANLLTLMTKVWADKYFIKD